MTTTMGLARKPSFAIWGGQQFGEILLSLKTSTIRKVLPRNLDVYARRLNDGVSIVTSAPLLSVTLALGVHELKDCSTQ